MRPHLLILDEPTNHLDVDAREALVQALNEYDGAVILISHDRHMVELTADRWCWSRMARPATTRQHRRYIDLVLGRNQPKAEAKPKAVKVDRKAASQARDDARALKKAAGDAEQECARLTAECAAIDRAMAGAPDGEPGLAKLSMSELSRRRAALQAELALAEARWLEASERSERRAA
jgi:ATP-binding cassette subfamily F protein 3